MLFAIDYNYNTETWHAEKALYSVYTYGVENDPDRVVYVGF